MKLTVRDILKVNNGLRALHGHEKQVIEQGISKVIIEPAKLSGPIRARIARNCRLCEPVIESVQEAFRGLEDQFAAEVAADPIPAEGAPDHPSLLKAWQERARERNKKKNEEARKIQDAEEDVEFRTIPFGELQLDKNEFITTAILELIDPILTDVPE